jgi:mannosyl-oligosaccharide alpha-1,2-mannosidase
MLWSRGCTVLTFRSAANGQPQQPSNINLVAEVGSLSLEFTRLSQVTGDPKYYDAIQRITDVFDEQQNRTRLPGMWPIHMDLQDLSSSDGAVFSLGAMADSLYEYLPKVCSGSDF